mmetsp:Transcript_68669/g.217187  ORF Transcript_68669/g.217187 Transcript_68669/m.217187 type:complete len:345 (+) Transcript_68669:816-1850(+)
MVRGAAKGDDVFEKWLESRGEGPSGGGAVSIDKCASLALPPPEGSGLVIVGQVPPRIFEQCHRDLGEDRGARAVDAAGHHIRHHGALLPVRPAGASAPVVLELHAVQCVACEVSLGLPDDGWALDLFYRVAAGGLVRDDRRRLRGVGPINVPSRRRWLGEGAGDLSTVLGRKGIATRVPEIIDLTPGEADRMHDLVDRSGIHLGHIRGGAEFRGAEVDSTGSGTISLRVAGARGGPGEGASRACFAVVCGDVDDEVCIGDANARRGSGARILPAGARDVGLQVGSLDARGLHARVCVLHAVVLRRSSSIRVPLATRAVQLEVADHGDFDLELFLQEADRMRHDV